MKKIFYILFVLVTFGYTSSFISSMIIDEIMFSVIDEIEEEDLSKIDKKSNKQTEDLFNHTHFMFLTKNTVYDYNKYVDFKLPSPFLKTILLPPNA